MAAWSKCPQDFRDVWRPEWYAMPVGFPSGGAAFKAPSSRAGRRLEPDALPHSGRGEAGFLPLDRRGGNG
jgi:hypothetical protein